MMNRRKLLTALGVCALSTPLGSLAQQPAKVWRIGVLLGGTAASTRHLVEAFFNGMADLGYQEGRNVRYEVRYRTGSNETIEQFARELAAVKVDLIWALGSGLWALGSAAAAAAQKTTASIPIVFALAADAVSAGLVRSLAAPGTNATGITMLTSELAAKRLEILNEIFPKARRVGVLHNPGDGASVAQLPFVRNAAQTLGKELMIVEARAPEEFAMAFAQLKRWRAEALQILANTLFFTHRQVLLDAAAENRWVTVSSSKEYAEAGGVVSYGANYVDSCRRSAAYVDKILKGTKPGELPVQQPVKFEFVINLKGAKAMGMTIPRSVLLRADEVIE